MIQKWKVRLEGLCVCVTWYKADKGKPRPDFARELCQLTAFLGP